MGIAWVQLSICLLLNFHHMSIKDDTIFQNFPSDQIFECSIIIPHDELMLLKLDLIPHQI